MTRDRHIIQFNAKVFKFLLSICVLIDQLRVIWKKLMNLLNYFKIKTGEWESGTVLRVLIFPLLIII